MKSQDLKKIKLPDLPGVYIFKRKTAQNRREKNPTPPNLRRARAENILYIGKATSLKDRVKSYFSSDLINTRGPLIVDMVFKADKIDFIETGNTLEALVLEASLIKKHEPYYNTKEKDNKSFNYVIITDENLPKVLIERGKNIDFKKLKTKDYRLKTIFGPFTNSNQLRDALRILRRIFPFIDKSSIQKDKSTFYRQIGLAPDVKNKIAINKYKKNIKNLKMFFGGFFGDLRKNLEKEMLDLARVQKFEEANEIKNKLFALDHIEDVALIKRENNYPVILQNNGIRKEFRIESYDVAHISGKSMVGVMCVVVNGELSKSDYRKFKIKTVKGSNDTASLQEILRRRLGHKEWQKPQLIVADGGIAQKRALELILKQNKLEIPVVAVVKDSRHKPRSILGNKKIIENNKLGILLANQESHRFAINFHRKLRGKLI